MTTTIIDWQGRLHDWSASADVAVKDQGCVAFRSYGAGSLEVFYKPDAITPKALLRAVELLAASDCDRVALAAWTTDWQTSVFGNRAAAIERMMGATTQAPSGRKGHFLSRRHAPSAIAADATFGPIREAWSAARGAKDQRLMEVVRAASSCRYLEVIPQEGAAKLVLDAVGDGYSLYGNGWKSIAVGGRFEDMPDYDYACRAAQAYRETFQTGQPVFEDVTALVQLLHAGRLLLKYRRVILPIGGGEHPGLLLGATLGQQVTRLPPGTGEELGVIDDAIHDETSN